MKLFSTTGLLLSGALALSEPAVFAQGPSAQCAIASFQPAPASLKKTRRFSAKTVLELRPVVTIAPGLPRSGDTLEVRYFAPTGNLYEARAFTLPTEETGGRDRHEDSDEVHRNNVAAPPLLVGGTVISSSSIFGTWRAEIWTLGARQPACASTFEITR